MNQMDNIDLNLYKTFLTVAKLRSISKAADELYVSQPAISYSIKQLEKELGCTLFERTSKGVIPTKEAGKMLFYVENAYNTLFLAKKITMESNDLISGEIKIGVPTHIGIFLVSKIIKIFNERYPGIKFTIINKSTKDMVELLEKKELDLIIDSYPIESFRNDIKVLDLIEIENCFAGNERYKDLSKETVNIMDMRKYPLLLPGKHTSTRIALEKQAKDYIDGLESYIDVSTTEMMLDLTEKGLGIGYFAKLSVEKFIKNKDLFEIRTNIDLPKTKICIAYIDKFVSKASNEFINILVEELEKEKNKAKKELRISVTNNCIYNCEFCHKEGIKNKREIKMNSDDIAYLFKISNKNMGIKGVKITGGEPLCRKDIVDVVKKLKKQGSRVTLTTNGFLLDENENMQIGNYLDKINISLHTLEKEKYENTCQKENSINKVLDNILKLRARYPLLNIGINTVLIKGVNSSVEDIEKMIRFASSINASLKFIEFFPDTSSKCVSIDSLIPYLELNGFKLKKNLFRKKTYANNKMDVVLTRCTCSEVKKSKNPSATCKSNNDIFVTPDGKISICRYIEHEVDILENVKKRDEKKLTEAIECVYENMGNDCIFELNHIE